MDTMSLTAKYEDEMIAIRRHIHRHPELSNKEYKDNGVHPRKTDGIRCGDRRDRDEDRRVAVSAAETGKPLRSARISTHFR